MLKTILKVILVAIGLIVLPTIIMAVLSIFGLALPLVGLLLIIFMPIVLIGVIIGFRNGKKKAMS